jgi:hypothetical protein
MGARRSASARRLFDEVNAEFVPGAMVVLHQVIELFATVEQPERGDCCAQGASRFGQILMAIEISDPMAHA